MTKVPRNKLVFIDNPDKGFHEKWNVKRNLVNIPHPFQCCIMGPPNSGKSSIVQSIIYRARPEFVEIYVIHCDPTYTEEYDILGDTCTMLEEIPALEDWEGKEKTLVVLDDLEFKYMPNDQRRNLDRLYGYASTHKHLSVILCAQDSFNIPPGVRRCANLWILFKMYDVESLAMACRKTGIKKHEFETIFKNIITAPHDSLWIDMTANTPKPLRKNGYIEIIRKKNDDEISKTTTSKPTKHDKLLKPNLGQLFI